MSELTPSPEPQKQQAPRRKRPLLWCAVIAAVLIAVVSGGLAWWMNSAQFAQMVREHVIAAIEDGIGGHVELGSFQWSLRHLEADADNVVLHGNEGPNDTPFARIDHLHVALSVFDIFSPRILLRDLTVVHPQIHLIVYPDQTTNQPQPHVVKKQTKSGLDTFFDLKAGHVAVDQGMFDLDNRAESFDFQSRYQPLDFEANDASLLLQYVPARGTTPESYHIDAGVTDLNLARGKLHVHTQGSQLHGILQASLDLTKNAAYLRSMRLTAHATGTKDHTLNITGSLTNFSHPRWESKIAGDLDLDMLDPILGYPDAPDGIAHLQVTAAGEGNKFRIDGPVRIEHASYVGTGINAKNLDITTVYHADNEVMHIAQTVVKPTTGGEIDADVLLQDWLPHNPIASVSAPQPAPQKPQSHDVLKKEPDNGPILVNGKVTALLKGVSLDTVMDFTSPKQFQRLGFSVTLDGPAEAVWTKGDVNSLTVHAALSAHAAMQRAIGEVPANGTIDATYTHRNGGVDVKALNLTMPASHLEAHGHVGAFPLTSPTSLNVDCESHDLSEFDTVLRDLGLAREGKSGVSALPVALHGEGDFHVLWEGSLISPRLTGKLKATQIGLEIPVRPDENNTQPRWISWDEADAEGTYDAQQIAILHGHLQRGTEEIALDGTITAVDEMGDTTSQKPVRHVKGQVGVNARPAFDANSLLHAHVHATHLAVADLLPFTGLNIPVSGTLDAQFEADGPLHSPGGSGWAQLSDAVAYDEQFSKIRTEGSLANHQVHITSFLAQAPAGTVEGSGTYDIPSGRFDARAHGSNIELVKLKNTHPLSDTLQGRLTFTATATGTKDDPHVEGHAEVNGLTLQGQALGSVQVTAHTTNGAMMYDVTSHTDTAEVQAHGQTVLHGDFTTQAQVNFSHFDIGALLKHAHVDSITGESALAGTANVSGPLKQPEKLRGDVLLNSAAATVAGVHLHSEGAVQATLAGSVVHLSPVHIMGDQTDIRAQGTLVLTGDRKLDMSANGSVNLKLAETLNRDLTADGTTTFQVEAHGPVANPQLRGQIDFQNGSLSLGDIPNGLSQIQGRLEFNQNRLEVRSLTAMTGGGQLALGGYLTYQHGIYADLTATGKGIRIRYPQGVSSQADANLRFQGTQQSSQLTGTVMITRFSVSENLDLATLAAQAKTTPTIAPPDAPSNRIRLDVHITSSPQLNFQNAFAKLAGDVDLRLRGTVATPSLLGRVSVTEGSAMVAGTRYDLQRGEINFSNPVRIQPNIDLNATARVEDYDITLGLHGTPDKMSVSYRSDPPLPEADVVALLAVGRTQSEQGIYTQQQQSANSTTDVLLGGALNATMSSRVQKLFGAGSVKVDPSYLGALGNSTTRITVEEQVGRYVTLTYATNVDTSAQQLLQAEIAINRHVSVLVERDESGVFSMVLKNTRRYK